MSGAFHRIVKQVRHEAARQSWRRSKSIRWIIGIVLILLIAGLFPHDQSASFSGYSVGSLWTNEDVVAPFSYPVYKDYSRYQQDVRVALDDLYPVFVPDTAAADSALTRFDATWSLLTYYINEANRDSSADAHLTDSVRALGIASGDWKLLLVASAQPEFASHLTEARTILRAALERIEHHHMLTAATQDDPTLAAAHSISIRTAPQEESIFDKDSLLSLDAAANSLFMTLDVPLRSERVTVRHALSNVAATALIPTIRFNANLTGESRQAIVDRVPRTDGIVVEGQRIVSKGEVITPAIKASLESLSRARIDRGGLLATLGRIAGTIGHVAVIVMLLVLYLKFIRRRIYNDNAQVLLLALALLFPAVLAFLSVRIQLAFPLEYLILVPVASMLLTIAFDSRTGFYATVVTALLVAGIRGNDYSVALAGLIAGAFAAYTVRDLRSRGQLFKSIAYIFLGYLIAISALSLEQATPLQTTVLHLVAALANALISPVLTLAALYVVETIFDTVSDIRLAELDNINHPLLRELALRAPGTYQHTMLVAQLAENAAIAIGANPLLAKVGAYFHDVGKLVDPTDFVENQVEGNVHTNLSPLESAERVKRHVQKGMELAQAHELPGAIIDFIPMHHGTLPISFFYQLARSSAPEGEPIDEAAFRYPGPRPNTKETAILMLADAAEAIARTLAQSSEGITVTQMEESIESLIRTRFDQAQLDMSDITVRDLTVIRSVFTRLLTGVHHARIAYPTDSNDIAESASDSVTTSHTPTTA